MIIYYSYCLTHCCDFPPSLREEHTLSGIIKLCFVIKPALRKPLSDDFDLETFFAAEFSLRKTQNNLNE